MTGPGAPFLRLDRISHRAALVGRVVDQLSQIALAGALVEIVDAPAAYLARLANLKQGRPGATPDRLTSDDRGFFRWLDLPAGRYTLRASLAGTRYAAATATADVVANAAASAELALAPAAVTGIVHAADLAGPLAMARVRLVDSGESTFTGDDGRFTLSPVEPGGARVLELRAQRYAIATRTVAVLPGTTTTTPTITLAPL